MAIYPIMFGICAPFVGSFQQRAGRKNVIVFGQSLMAIATVIFGLASLCQTARGFMRISALARFCQGIADASITVTMPSIVCREFPKNQEKYLGFLCMAIGVGTCLGALTGAFLSKVLTYAQVFFVISALVGSAAAVQSVCLPSRLNNKVVEDVSSDKITYLDFLRNPKIIVLLCL